MKLAYIRLPTLLALLLLVGGLSATIYLVEQGTSIFSNASSAIVPNQVKIVNVTQNSFSISWLTPSPTKSMARITEKNPFATPQKAFDIRDDHTSVARRTHFITANNLKPNTTYTVELVVNGKTEKQPLTAITGVELDPPQHVVDPAYGTLSTHGRPVTDGLVYITFLGSQTLGGLVDPDGSWVVPLGHTRTQDLNYYFIPTRQDRESISFVSAHGTLDLVTTIENDSPLYAKYVETSDKSSEKIETTRMMTVAQAQTISTLSDSVNSAFHISLPKHNSSLTSSKPAFKGTGVPGKKVVITIIGGSKPISATTTTTMSGSWSWTPPELVPGAYSATISSVNQNDKPVALSVNFTLLKSGSQVLQAATPSASFPPSPSIRASVVPSPTLSVTPSTTISASPMPITGNTTATNFLLIISSVTILFGLGGWVMKTKH